MGRSRTLLLLLTAMAGNLLRAQDLDPRAYIRVPVHSTTVITGFAYSYGGVVTDQTLPVKDVVAHVSMGSVAVLRTFGFFGLTAQAMAALPLGFGDASGTVNGTSMFTQRSGAADMRLRFSVLLTGAPATGLEGIAKAPRKTIVGMSLNTVAPVGQYASDKLINLGANRWSFRPEIGISQPVGKRWLMDLYTGVWLFTPNHAFYPGQETRTQQPMLAIQGHVSYNFKSLAWVALDATLYFGGNSKVGDKWNNDRQENSRIGATLVTPIGGTNTLKFAASTGAIVRSGQDFTTFSIAWQHSWFGKRDREFLERRRSMRGR